MENIKEGILENMALGAHSEHGRGILENIAKGVNKEHDRRDTREASRGGS